MPREHYLTIVGLFVAGLLATKGWKKAASAEPLAGEADPRAVLWICCALVTSWFAQLAVIVVAAWRQQPFLSWFASLPLIPIDQRPPLNAHTPDWVGISIASLALVQAALLALLYRAMRGRSVSRGSGVTIGAAALVMLISSLVCPAMANDDAYLYAGFAHLGGAAYHPPAVRFAGELGLVNDMWATPIMPCAYGPLWLWLSVGIAKIFPHLGALLFAFRMLGAALVLVCVWLLMRLRQEPAIVALFALNPVVMNQFVVDAHNDIVGLTLLLGAMVLAAKRPWAAVVLVGLAGAAKLPFALAGAVAFHVLPRLSLRVICALAGVGIAVAITMLGSHGEYFAAAASAGSHQNWTDPGIRAGHAAAIVAALVAVGAAVIARRFAPGAAWTMVSFGAMVLPWYTAWSIPYALAEGSFAAVFLIALPVAAFYFTTAYAMTIPTWFLTYAIVLTPVALAVWGVGARRRYDRAPIAPGMTGA